MSYAQPFENLSFTNPPAAKLLDTLIDGIAIGADPNSARETWLGVYPDYAAEFERALGLRGNVVDFQDAQAVADAIRNHIAASDRREVIDNAVAEHQLARLTDPARMAELAANFRAKTLTSSQLDTIEMPEPLIEGLFDRAALVRVYGPPRSFKSFVVLDMAQCIALGMPWQGRAVTQSKVLYVMAEGASTGALKRTRAWERQNGIPEGEAGVVIYPDAVQIDDVSQMRELLAAVVVDDFKLVVFDTQARCTEGINEDNNSEMNVVIGKLDRLRKASGATVMLVHHCGNEGGRGRGASGVLGAIDSEFEVKRDGNTLNLELITKKIKDEDEGVPTRLTMVKHSNIMTPEGLKDSLAVSGGYVSAQQGTAEVLSIPALTALQEATLVALARYDGVGPTQVAKDLGGGRDKSLIAQDFTALKRLECVTGEKSAYKITDRGWAVLQHRHLTTGYHTVAPLGEPEAA